MKTSELVGDQLNRAVAICENRITADGFFLVHTKKDGDFRSATPERYSTDWAQGGPIIERERLTLNREILANEWLSGGYNNGIARSGPTPLIASMRAYVASKFGDEIPEALP